MIYDINVNSLIKNYFNLYLNNKFLNCKYISRKKKRVSLNKIYVSKAEIKHTNSKAIITIFVYNKEKLSLLNKIKKLKNFLIKKLLLLFVINKNLYKDNMNNFNSKAIRLMLYKELILIRRYKLRLNLNKYKFEEKFLYILSGLIKKLYKKKIEFNIISLKSIVFNSDILTNILTLKIRRRKKNASPRPVTAMRTIIDNVKLPAR